MATVQKLFDLSDRRRCRVLAALRARLKRNRHTTLGGSHTLGGS